MKHSVVCPIEKVKELILEQHPNFYVFNKTTQKAIVDKFVKPIDAEEMLNHMIETEKQ